jgi:F-type H+-transporting ATPase subunit b
MRAIVAGTLGLTIAVLSSGSALASDKLELIPDYAFFGLLGDDPGLGSLWVMLVGFVLLIFPLNAMIFQPIFGVLDARTDRIKGARDRSQQLEAEADSVLERYETAIREARAESEATRQGQLATAREEQTNLTQQARGEAENELEQARASLNQSLEEARTTLRANAEDLATAAAEQVLGRVLS